MTMLASKLELIQQLQREVHSLQGHRKHTEHTTINGLGIIEKAFPEHVFPTSVVHEFISYNAADATSTNGFIAAILTKLMQQNGICFWIGIRRTIYPPALKFFGIDPQRIIFIDLNHRKDVLWAVEEALKCNSLTAVVGELAELSFKESRRLQLAIEQSHVTGFIHRYNPRTENIVACVTRWKIRSIASAFEDEMPGVGYPRWDVQLHKVRNGKPGQWQVEWFRDNIRHIHTARVIAIPITQQKTG